MSFSQAASLAMGFITTSSARTVFAAACVMACGGLLTGCASHANAPWADLGAANSRIAQSPTIQPGNKLKINVFNEPNLSGTYEVTTSGGVAMPLIGTVEAEGATATQFTERLRRRLAQGYLKNPRVAVEVENYRPVFIHGEVRKSGEYLFRAGLTLRDAVALAGGYTYRADEGYVLLTRRNQTEPVRVRMPSAASVLPGDNIRVPERFF
jgi:polysaccharide export outer membrane protein